MICNQRYPLSQALAQVSAYEDFVARNEVASDAQFIMVFMISSQLNITMTNEGEISHPPISEVQMCTDRLLQAGGSAGTGRGRTDASLPLDRGLNSQPLASQMRNGISRNYGLTCIRYDRWRLRAGRYA